MVIIRDTQAHMRGEVLFELINAETGEVDARHHYNLLTFDHKELVASWLANQDPTPPSYIALGTGAYAQHNEANQDAEIALKTTGADQQLAQGFILDDDYDVNAVLLYLQRVGSGDIDVIVDIYSDAAGLPSTLIASSVPVSFNGLPVASMDWVRFEFTPSQRLSVGLQYHLALRAVDYVWVDGVLELIVGADSSASTYADGEVTTYDGSAWTVFSPAADMIFRVTVDPETDFAAIVGEVTRKPVTSATLQSPTVARLLANYTIAEANGRHGMAGLLNAASTGILSAAVAIDLIKLPTQTLNVYWLITVN